MMSGEEILVRNHQHALKLSTITIYGSGHLIDGSYMEPYHMATVC